MVRPCSFFANDAENMSWDKRKEVQARKSVVPMRKRCPLGKMLCRTRKNFATLGEKRDNSVRDRGRMTGERQPFVQTEQKVQNDLTNL